MLNKKRGQISTEYLIIVGFITFAVLVTLGIAYFYTNSIKDGIKMNQIENFANELISTSESIFFAGEPSQLEITGYIPEGVNDIAIVSKEVIFNITTSSGENIRSFPSRVVIEGTVSPSSGVKVLQLTAEEDKVVIT
ncbi:MAG: hypothetical protein ABIG28_02475 [archaeon]